MKKKKKKSRKNSRKDRKRERALGPIRNLKEASMVRVREFENVGNKVR